MKTLTLKLLVLFVLSAFTGCKDNDPSPITDSFEGTWIGKYGNGSKVPDWFWSFEIDPNGVIHELDNGGKKIGKGMWTKAGNEFKSTYHNDEPYDATYSMKAIVNEEDGTLKGTWGFENNEADGGTFVLNKKRVDRR